MNIPMVTDAATPSHPQGSVSQISSCLLHPSHRTKTTRPNELVAKISSNFNALLQPSYDEMHFIAKKFHFEGVGRWVCKK